MSDTIKRKFEPKSQNVRNQLSLILEFSVLTSTFPIVHHRPPSEVMAKASILIFVSLNLISFATSAKLVKVYKSCELTSSNKSVAPDYLCNVEHTSSSNAFVNIQATFVRPLFDMIVNESLTF